MAITAPFFLLCLITVASLVFFPFVFKPVDIGGTGYCVTNAPKHVVMWGFITTLIYDSTVFAAISWRLLQVSQHDHLDGVQRVRAIISGTTLPKFTRTLLRDGQIYYLLALFITGFDLVFFLLPAPVSTGYRSLSGCSTLAITHILACRVFRHTKLGPLRSNLYWGVAEENHGLGRVNPRRPSAPMPIAFAHSTRPTFTHLHVASDPHHLSISATPCRAPTEPNPESVIVTEPGGHV